jgi:hypothetical protein
MVYFATRPLGLVGVVRGTTNAVVPAFGGQAADQIG